MEDDGSSTESDAFYDELSDEEAVDSTTDGSQVRALPARSFPTSNGAVQVEQSGPNPRPTPTATTATTRISTLKRPRVAVITDISEARAQTRTRQSHERSNHIVRVKSEVSSSTAVANAGIQPQIVRQAAVLLPTTAYYSSTVDIVAFSCIRCASTLAAAPLGVISDDDDDEDGAAAATLFCLCCRRPLPITVFSADELAKDNYRRCPPCVCSDRDVQSTLVEELPPRLGMSSRVEWCLGQLVRLADDASAALKVLEADPDLAGRLTVWARSRDEILLKQCALARQRGHDNAVMDGRDEVFGAWIANEVESVSLRMSQALLLSAFVASRGVSIPGYLTSSLTRFRHEVGAGVGPAECLGCSAPLVALGRSSCAPSYCHCCLRMLPLSFFTGGEATCRLCVGSILDTEDPSRHLTTRDHQEWIDAACRLVSTLKLEQDESNLSDTLVSDRQAHQRLLESNLEVHLTRSIDMQLRHRAVLQQDFVSVRISLDSYTERVAADEELISSLSLLVEILVKTVVQQRGTLSSEIQQSIAGLNRSKALPEAIMEHVDIITMPRSRARQPDSNDEPFAEWVSFTSDVSSFHDMLSRPLLDAIHVHDSGDEIGQCHQTDRPNQQRTRMLFDFVWALRDVLLRDGHSVPESTEAAAAEEAIAQCKRRRKKLRRECRRSHSTDTVSIDAMELSLQQALTTLALMRLRTVRELRLSLTKSAVKLLHKLQLDQSHVEAQQGSLCPRKKARIDQ